MQVIARERDGDGAIEIVLGTGERLVVPPNRRGDRLKIRHDRRRW